MVRWIAKAGVLIAIVLAVAAPAEAFGRRHAPSCTYAPVYDCWYSPCYCPPYYPPLPFPTGVDCVCNHTNQALRMHVTSAYGSVQAVVPPGYCMYFRYYKDGKNRVVSAFTLQNDLVANFEFTPVDQTGRPKHICLPISRPVAGAPKEAPQRVEMESHGGMIGQPSNEPF